MRKHLLLLMALTLTVSLSAFGQSTKIIDEDFQDWDPTEDEVPDDCEDGLVHESDIVRTMNLVTSGGDVEIDVHMLKCGIAPECGSKRQSKGGENGDGITDGYVELSKAETEVDTIGELVFGPIPQVDSIRFGHSATGDNRGIRIYKSADGETWERATENEFFESDDSQAGDLRSVEINEENVYIKFTSGIDIDGEEVSQHSRLHNIEVFGEPGEFIVGIADIQISELQVISLGHGKFKLDGIYSNVKVYNTVGKMVYTDTDIENSIIDLGRLPNGIYIIKGEDATGRISAQKVLNY